jgi:hypothetical protein
VSIWRLYRFELLEYWLVDWKGWCWELGRRGIVLLLVRSLLVTSVVFRFTTPYGFAFIVALLSGF